jgi:hypothetical protein
MAKREGKRPKRQRIGRGQKPSENVPPNQVKKGEPYLLEGLIFRCIGKPRPGPDPDYTLIPSRKFWLRQNRLVKNTDTVGVYRS